MMKLSQFIKHFFHVIFFLLMLLFGLVAFLGHDALNWLASNFGVGMEQILFTLASPLEGADTDFLSSLWHSLTFEFILYLITIFFVFFFGYWLFRKKNFYLVVRLKKDIRFSFQKIYYCCIFLFFLLSTVSALVRLDEVIGYDEYIRNRANESQIYETHYVDPENVTITAPEKKKNLLYIYMESMETTYASMDVGGGQPDINYIPNLTQIASENISFSNNGQMGGWHVTSGSSWTMGALFSTTSGIPFSFPVNRNDDMSNREKFAPGLTALGDILATQGYTQEFLCGSDGAFAGRAKYFQEHKDYRISDYGYALEEGLIPKDYHVFWGYDDRYLYEIAKTRLTQLANQEEPFNFTMLTVDTHHTGGYVCEICSDSTYSEDLPRVLECADRQILDFLNWCKEQPFYEDTVIIITGDHPRMDQILVAGYDDYDRPIYNAFINVDPAISENSNFKYREFTAFDMFPTTLAALGNTIEGERLGFGTNLFSEKETICEELGYDYFNQEIDKRSSYYTRFYAEQ